jgi:hypothetical protein
VISSSSLRSLDLSGNHGGGKDSNDESRNKKFGEALSRILLESSSLEQIALEHVGLGKEGGKKICAALEQMSARRAKSSTPSKLTNLLIDHNCMGINLCRRIERAWNKLQPLFPISIDDSAYHGLRHPEEMDIHSSETEEEDEEVAESLNVTDEINEMPTGHKSLLKETTDKISRRVTRRMSTAMDFNVAGKVQKLGSSGMSIANKLIHFGNIGGGSLTIHKGARRRSNSAFGGVKSLSVHLYRRKKK